MNINNKLTDVFTVNDLCDQKAINKHFWMYKNVSQRLSLLLNYLQLEPTLVQLNLMISEPKYISHMITPLSHSESLTAMFKAQLT